MAIPPTEPTTADVLTGVIQGGGSDPDGDPASFTRA